MAPAGRFELVPDDSRVWITGRSTLHPIKASGSGVTGWVELLEEEIDGELRIEVARLRSGNPLLDREAQRRLDPGTHPEIVGSVVGSRRREQDVFDVHGDVSFRGHTGPAKGEVVAATDSGSVRVTGSETFDVRDWGFEVPRLGLLKVSPVVEVRIELVGRR